MGKLREDFRACFERDPAAKKTFFGRLEVILTYAGFHAIALHRFTHFLHKLRIPFFPRLFSQINRFLTGIEIHPGAKIEGGFFIDHGMGVVIGETTEIGKNCTLFQGVTLGGTGKETGKRHPTLGENIVVGSGAKVLGNIMIGNNVYIGSNAVVLKDVPDNATVVGVPGRVVRYKGKRVSPAAQLDHTHIPDPIKDRLQDLQEEIAAIEEHLKMLGKEMKVRARFAEKEDESSDL